MVLASGPLREAQSFLYVAPDETDPRQLGPILVVPGGLIVGDFTAGPPGTAGFRNSD